MNSLFVRKGKSTIGRTIGSLHFTFSIVNDTLCFSYYYIMFKYEKIVNV